MNNEIKEILEYYRKYMSIKDCVKLSKIEDYITNLQESEAYHYGYYKDYKQRIDKAVEYITSEESIGTFKTVESRDEWLKIHHNLLNILQGEDNE